MSGKPLNSEQVKLYMKKRKQGKSQECASAQCGFSERSGRRIDKRLCNLQIKNRDPGEPARILL